MWLLIGILFRLPMLAQMPQPVPNSQARTRHGALAGCGWEKIGLMCGIAGIAAAGSAEALRPAAERMAVAMSHRGPDSQGVQLLRPCLLVNARLAIIDLSERGRQPMSSADGNLWITYNGETYNAAELRAELEQRASSVSLHDRQPK